MWHVGCIQHMHALSPGDKKEFRVLLIVREAMAVREHSGYKKGEIYI
jgi:hypothetical protein